MQYETWEEGLGTDRSGNHAFSNGWRKPERVGFMEITVASVAGAIMKRCQPRDFPFEQWRDGDIFAAGVTLEANGTGLVGEIAGQAGQAIAKDSKGTGEALGNEGVAGGVFWRRGVSRYEEIVGGACGIDEFALGFGFGGGVAAYCQSLIHCVTVSTGNFSVKTATWAPLTGLPSAKT